MEEDGISIKTMLQVNLSAEVKPVLAACLAGTGGEETSLYLYISEHEKHHIRNNTENFIIRDWYS